MTVDSGTDAGVDEFDLDLRLGELEAWRPGHLLVDAQTDGNNCLPTGGRGWGATCNTQDNTCPGTCAGRDTCPHTACGHTCADTCGHTCADTCRATDCGNTCGGPTDCGSCANTHCFTCRSGCQIP